MQARFFWLPFYYHKYGNGGKWDIGQKELAINNNSTRSRYRGNLDQCTANFTCLILTYCARECVIYANEVYILFAYFHDCYCNWQ